MSLRLIGVLAMLVLSLALAVPASATEAGGGTSDQGETGEMDDGGSGAPAHEKPPSIEEIGSGSEISKKYFPEQYEEPSWFQWLLYPLLIAGILVVLALLLAYLRWQPHFANERRAKKRR